MSRRHRAVKREILPDPKFGDVVITRFMNALMYDGKKSTAEGRRRRSGMRKESPLLNEAGIRAARFRKLSLQNRVISAEPLDLASNPS